MFKISTFAIHLFIWFIEKSTTEMKNVNYNKMLKYFTPKKKFNSLYISFRKYMYIFFMHIFVNQLEDKNGLV